MKVKTNYVPPSTDYLTEGKVYEAFESDEWGYPTIINEDGDESRIQIHSCAHLGGEPWEVVSDDD